MKKLLRALSPAYALGLFGKSASGKLFGKLDEDEDEEKKKGAVTPATTTPAATMKKGGSVSSASKRADGIAKKGKTKGRMV